MLNLQKDTVVIPANQIPTFRTSAAIERGVEKNILIKTWGGLGDQICAEPTLRYAFDTFKGCKITIASEAPELFMHLTGRPNFNRMFDLRVEQPLWDDYLCFNTINDTSNLSWEFMSHMIVNCVDYPSLCAFRCQMPISYKQIQLHPPASALVRAKALLDDNDAVAVHPGRHWQSKTFPKDWWDEVIQGLVKTGLKPVIIGANTDDNRGTVDVDTTGCIDLRNHLSVMESVALLQAVKVLLSNDSAPIHMAASGNAHIGFIATCKHPDYIMHWRAGRRFGWRMENLGLGGIWDVLDYCPNKENKVEAENVGDYLLKWLPAPSVVVDWAYARYNGL